MTLCILLTLCLLVTLWLSHWNSDYALSITSINLLVLFLTLNWFTHRICKLLVLFCFPDWVVPLEKPSKYMLNPKKFKFILKLNISIRFQWKIIISGNDFYLQDLTELTTVYYALKKGRFRNILNFSVYTWLWSSLFY